jgi:S1-C subfamily serine protease
VSVDKTPIADYDDLYNALDTRGAGDRVRLQVIRENRPIEIETALIMVQ